MVAAPGFGQSSFETSRVKPTQRVTAAPVGLITVAVGSAKWVELPFRVAPGYHINSNKPSSELLLPTVLSLSPPTNVALGGLTYPAGQERSFPFSPDEKLNVYSGDFALSTLVRVARNTPLGRYRVKGVLKYQACDDRACYPPGQVPIAFDVKVTKAAGTGTSAGRRRRNPAQSPHVHQ